MTFLHPSQPLRKISPEILITLLATLLLILALLVINLINHLPTERAVPAPVVATPKVSVHFSKLQGSTSITEQTVHQTPANSTDHPLESALKQLLNGPTQAEKEEGFYSEIPQGTKLLGVQVSHQVVHVNLSKEFTQGGGSTSMIQRVKELKDTIASVEGNYPVKIEIEGKPLNVLGGEGLELN